MSLVLAYGYYLFAAGLMVAGICGYSTIQHTVARLNSAGAPKSDWKPLSWVSYHLLMLSALIGAWILAQAIFLDPRR